MSGSIRFKKLILKGDYQTAMDVAKQQVSANPTVAPFCGRASQASRPSRMPIFLRSACPTTERRASDLPQALTPHEESQQSCDGSNTPGLFRKMKRFVQRGTWEYFFAICGVCRGLGTRDAPRGRSACSAAANPKCGLL